MQKNTIPPLSQKPPLPPYTTKNIIKKQNKEMRHNLCTKTKKVLDASGRVDKSAQISTMMRGTGTGDK